MYYSPGFAGRCSPSGWHQATQTLTCTLFDPGNIGGFGEKCLCFTSAQLAEIPAPWYIFPSRALKPAHGPTWCVTGLRDGGGGIICRHPAGISALFCRKKPEIRRVSRLNQRITLPDASKCLKTVGWGEINVAWRHKFFWNAGKSYSKNWGLQHNKSGLCHPAVFLFSAVV